MTPDRLVECLELLHWTTETLAEALECMGLTEMPPKAAAWIEVLALAHATAEDGKPKSLKGKRYSVGN